MMEKKDKFEEKAITPRSEDFSKWYHDVVREAELAENGQVRGTMIIKPNGYSMWEKIQSGLDRMFKEKGVRNAYFPLLIPEEFLKREKDHVEGFSPEVAVVTHAGGKKLDEPLIIRPTSETIINDSFSRWIHSHKDLPLKINQWANVLRWEMRPRLFLRTTEFLWQEGHTAHATAEEADDFARQMLQVYVDFAREVMAVPVVPGVKTSAERFAGADETYTIEAMMQDGKALQFATSHNLGTNFAEAFNIEFLNENNEKERVHQTSWGLSTRSIGGLVMTHSDDKGLVLPPRMAETKVVIIPILGIDDTKVLPEAEKLQRVLQEIGILCELDMRDLRAGDKFFRWEKQGVPLRVEIGPRDIDSGEVVVARRDTGEKESVKRNEIVTDVEEKLHNMQQEMYQKAKKFLEDNTVEVDSWEEFEKAIEDKKFVMAHWNGKAESEAEIKEKTKATIRCIPFEGKEEKGKCVLSGEESERRVLFARNY